MLLQCYYPAENPVLFIIDIQENSRIYFLRQRVVEALGRPAIEARDIRLFKSDISFGYDELAMLKPALVWLHEWADKTAQPPPNARVAEFLPDGPHADDVDNVDLLVVDTEVLELYETIGDSYGTYKRKLKRDLDQRINLLPPSKSPSEIVHSAGNLKEVFGREGPTIHIGCPGGIPSVIFNTALARLHKSLQNLEEGVVSASIVQLAGEFMEKSIKFYDQEGDREVAIKETLDAVFGAVGSWQEKLFSVQNIKPDALWRFEVFVQELLEVKNTLGLDGDPTLQAVISYSKIICSEQFKPFRHLCNFPAVTIGISGNRVEVSAVVCVGSIYVTKLLALDLVRGFLASDNTVRLARVLEALKRCHRDLRGYYMGVRAQPPPLDLACLYPMPTLVSSDKELPNLIYRGFLSRSGHVDSHVIDYGQVVTALYSATLVEGDKEVAVVVKFTARYNAAAHRLLAEASLAPKLYFCERVVGGLFMVVMDHLLSGVSVWQLQQDKVVPPFVAEEVERAVHILHGADIVFGDLRDPNILYIPPSETSPAAVKLVDFDWPGKADEGRYTTTLNRSDLREWAEGVQPYGIMCKEHDMWQLKRLKELCKEDNLNTGL